MAPMSDDSGMSWGPRRVAYRCVAEPAAVLLTGAFFGFRPGGRHPLAPGTIVVSNHVHSIDCLALVRVFRPRMLRFNSQASNFDLPVAGQILQAFATLRVGGGPEEVREFLESNTAALSRGECVVVYPEGDITTYATRVHEFRPGAFALAVHADAPVVPVALVPTGRTIGVWRRRPQLRAVVGAPMRPDPDLPYRAAREELRRRAQDFVSEALETALGG